MATLRSTFAGAPQTERGSGILVAGDVKTSYIAYGNGRSVILRSLVNPLEMIVYGEHSYNVTVARFSPNGEWVASGDVSGSVRVWGRRAPEHSLKLEIRALSGRVDDLDWSADGQRILVSGDGKVTFLRAFLWDAGSNVGEFDGHSKRVLSASFKPTRPFAIVSGGEDFLVNLYAGPPFRFKSSFTEHSNFVNCVRYSPDGTKFVTVSSDKKAFIFEGKTGEKLGELSSKDAHAGSIYAASWSPDSKQILTVSADKTAKVWDVLGSGSGSLNTTFLLGSGVKDMQVGCLWLGKYLLTVSLGGNINYLSLDDPSRPTHVISGHSKSITAIAVARDGDSTEIVSSSYDSVVVRWGLDTGYEGKLDDENFAGSLKNIVIAGRRIYFSGLDNNLWVATLSGDTLQDRVSVDVGSQIRDLDAIASKAQHAIVATDSELLLLRGSKVLFRHTVSYVLTTASISPDCKEVATGAEDGFVRLYSINEGVFKEEAVLEKHRGPITITRFSPDGSMVASGDQNREAVVWSREDADGNAKEWHVKVKNMLYHTARIATLSWSPDSLKVATGSVDTSVHVYDVTKPASARTTIKGAHLGGITSLAFVDESTLVTGGDDSFLRVWTV